VHGAILTLIIFTNRGTYIKILILTCAAILGTIYAIIIVTILFVAVHQFIKGNKI
jgi:hypothetical protein